MEKVKPVMLQIAKNELIVSTGQLIRSIDLEKLEALGLQQPPYSCSAIYLCRYSLCF